MEPIAVVAYHSGYGHTLKVAEAVVQGLKDGGAHAVLLNVEKVAEPIDGHADGWALIDAAHGVVFGSPTYMGTVSAPFKAFMDGSSKAWMAQSWKDKLAGGFTNSGSLSGDKLNTLQTLTTLAFQQCMVWVGSAEPAGYDAAETTINRIGSFTGVMTQAGNVPPEQAPGPGDLETARRYGVRFAKALKRWNKA